MTSGCSTDEKVLITGATGKIAFPIARALAERNEVWGAARLRNPGDRDRLAGRRASRPFALDMADRRLLVAARRFRLRVPRGGRHRHRRLDAVRRDERAQFRRAAVPLPRREGLRVLLDRLDLRVPGPAPAARDRSAGRAAAAATTASRKIAGRVGVHLGRRALRHPADDHPHLLDLRARGRRAGRPARS